MNRQLITYKSVLGVQTNPATSQSKITIYHLKVKSPPFAPGDIQNKPSIDARISETPYIRIIVELGGVK
ncbi:MAG: hypothetical protein ACO23H_19610, partial [Alphaproteobacteria bacterium]